MCDGGLFLDLFEKKGRYVPLAAHNDGAQISHDLAEWYFDLFYTLCDIGVSDASGDIGGGGRYRCPFFQCPVYAAHHADLFSGGVQPDDSRHDDQRKERNGWLFYSDGLFV